MQQRQREGQQIPVCELIACYTRGMTTPLALPSAAVYDLFHALSRQIAPARSSGASIRYTAPMLSMEDGDALHTTLRRRSGRSGGAAF